MEDHLHPSYFRYAGCWLEAQGGYTTSAWSSANRCQLALSYALIWPDENQL